MDILATDAPIPDASPLEYWDKVEHHVMTVDPELQEAPYGNNSALDEYESKLRDRIAHELETWWFCIHRLGVQGCFGELGKQIGWEIWVPGRPQPAAVQT